MEQFIAHVLVAVAACCDAGCSDKANAGQGKNGSSGQRESLENNAHFRRVACHGQKSCSKSRLGKANGCGQDGSTAEHGKASATRLLLRVRREVVAYDVEISLSISELSLASCIRSSTCAMHIALGNLGLRLMAASH